MDGIVLVYKPKRLTSHDVVAEIRKILQEKKVGHFGTLDPLATGLLLVSVGKATRFFPFFSKAEKIYTGQITLGFSTDTYDSLGKPTSPLNKNYPDKTTLLNAMRKFLGDFQQNPPLYSAKKYKGKPLYKLARKNKKVDFKPSKVFIGFFDLKAYRPPVVEFEVHCSSGTYIRSLAHDLGRDLGCGAHLSQLTRTQVGDFHVQDSFTLERINILAQKEKTGSFLIPLENLLFEYPKIVVSGTGSESVRNGRPVSQENILKEENPSLQHRKEETGKGRIFRVFDREGNLLALARRNSGTGNFHPFFVIASSHSKDREELSYGK